MNKKNKIFITDLKSLELEFFPFFYILLFCISFISSIFLVDLFVGNVCYYNNYTENISKFYDCIELEALFKISIVYLVPIALLALKKKWFFVCCLTVLYLGNMLGLIFFHNLSFVT